MYKRKCQECGKQMEFKLGAYIKPFCSKRCSDIHREKMYNAPDNGPAMPPLKVESITDEGYIALVKAIVARACHDVTHFKPGTQIRIQAEKFFESDHFANLTGLDGEAILRDLRKKAEKRKPDTRGRKPKPTPIGTPRSVLCVDTGVMYSSIKAAAEATGCHKSCIQEVCAERRNKTRGLHFKYVEEGAV